MDEERSENINEMRLELENAIADRMKRRRSEGRICSHVKIGEERRQP